MQILLPDLINAIFELLGSIFFTLNCKKLYKDKYIAGVSIIPTTFYAGWGFWNLFFYPMTGNILSAIAGVFVCAANTTWVVMALYYQKKFSDQFKKFPAQKNEDNVDAIE